MSPKNDSRRDDEPDEDAARIEADVERVLGKVGDVLDDA